MQLSVKASEYSVVARRRACFQAAPSSSFRRVNVPRTCLFAVQEKTDATGTMSDVEETTQKYGLEAGLYKTLTTKPAEGELSRTEQAKQLLTQYGSAYLITSISFAIVSFAACYAAVSAGLDMGALLSKFGLQATDTSETMGTVAIAYAAHKALSPIRFPPTVVATPIVARWIGSLKKPEQEEKK